MITNAKDISLLANPGTLPNVSEALLNWFQILTFTKVVKSVADFGLVETECEVSFRGVKQNMSPQRLSMKPEGQRSWNWETIHAQVDLILKTDDVISFGGVPYRVMAKADYKEYGYVSYDIVEDYRR